jgi:hypothetical protein
MSKKSLKTDILLRGYTVMATAPVRTLGSANVPAVFFG